MTISHIWRFFRLNHKNTPKKPTIFALFQVHLGLFGEIEKACEYLLSTAVVKLSTMISA